MSQMEVKVVDALALCKSQRNNTEQTLFKRELPMYFSKQQYASPSPLTSNPTRKGSCYSDSVRVYIVTSPLQMSMSWRRKAESESQLITRKTQDKSLERVLL